jgi:hypothetical protein
MALACNDYARVSASASTTDDTTTPTGSGLAVVTLEGTCGMLQRLDLMLPRRGLRRTGPAPGRLMWYHHPQRGHVGH